MTLTPDEIEEALRKMGNHIEDWYDSEGVDVWCDEDGNELVEGGCYGEGSPPPVDSPLIIKQAMEWLIAEGVCLRIRLGNSKPVCITSEGLVVYQLDETFDTLGEALVRAVLAVKGE